MNCGIALAIISFGKTEELEKFYRSIEQSDMSDIPKYIMFNTDRQRGVLSGPNVDIAMRFRRGGDHIFVCDHNLWLSSYRWMIQQYLQSFPLIIGTEADIWFEEPLFFRKHIQYFIDNDLGALNVCARYYTEGLNETQFTEPRLFYTLQGEYLLASRNMPWHMWLMWSKDLLNFFKGENELTDGGVFNFIKEKNKKQVYTLDCRKFCVHFDFRATIAKYPNYLGPNSVRCFGTKQQTVYAKDIKEIKGGGYMDIPFLKPILPSVERYQQHINKMHENGWFSNNGEFVQQFERDLQEYLQTSREIVVVSSATLGLIIAIKGLEIKKKVLVPSFTFASTVGAIQWCGLEHEYIDIDDYWCMDPLLIEEKLQTGEYDAIIPVHALGVPCAIKEFEQLAQKYNVKLLFDSASGIGATYNNRRIGNFGDIEVFSLHATKCLPIGEGGFLSIRDYKVAQTIRQLKNFGFTNDRMAYMNGINAKMPEIEAAIGIEALKDVKQHMRNRQKYVKQYQELIGDIVEFQKVRPESEHGYQILGVIAPSDGNVVMQEMITRGIQVRQYYTPPVHLHPAYSRDVVLPNTMNVSKHIISLPLYSIMDDITIEIVCKNLREILMK